MAELENDGAKNDGAKAATKVEEAAANVRQILGRPGEVWLPESGLDRLMLIRTAPAGH